jgi:2-(1,2-epoxy-1,2-dihydrophenyl)acetyl-CoA isomerase
MSSHQHILYEQTPDGVAILTLNRPQALNALMKEVLEEMNDVLDAITKPGGGARVLVLTGAGRGFSSGADLAAAGGGIQATGGKPLDVGRVLETHFNPLMLRFNQLPMPFITAVNGAAAGAGCSFALAGDFVIAAKSAYFLQAFVNIGLVPDAGSTYFLPRLIGKARATRMMMLGEKIMAEQALDWGMIHQVTEDADLMTTALALAGKLAKGPTRTYALIRQMTWASLDASFTEQLQREREAQKSAGGTADFVEGVMAFLQKRPANFTGA